MRKFGIVVLGLLLVVAALAAAGFRLQRGGNGWPRFIARSQQDALEADRARQRESAEAAPAAAQTAPIAPADKPAFAQTSPIAPADKLPASAFAQTSPIASADKPSSSWTDFRGPNRDGRYTATPIRTSWPREGLPQLWKQPVGGGYASFVVADGRAFTIEQRAATGGGCGVRHRDRPRTVDATAGTPNSRSRWAATVRARRRPGTKGASTRSAPKASCACSTPRRARSSGGEHPHRQRRRQSPVGHVRVTAHRR